MSRKRSRRKKVSGVRRIGRRAGRFVKRHRKEIETAATIAPLLF